MMCELAQELIKIRAHKVGSNIEVYPGKVKLPSDILRPQPTAEASNIAVKSIYLPEATVTWLSQQQEKKEKEKEKRERKRKVSVPKGHGNSHAKYVSTQAWNSLL